MYKNRYGFVLVFLSNFFIKNLMAQLPDGVIFHSSESIEQSFMANGKRWLSLIDNSTIDVGLYKLKVGERDPQPVHEYDEIYYVQQGEAKLLAGDSTFNASAGSLFYVKAGVTHRFFDITKDISVIVLFSKAKPSEKDIMAKGFAQKEIEKTALPDSIRWAVFHRCATMVIGIYLLPKVTGGDSTQLHKMDEVNVVLKGEGKFSVDGKDMKVKKGDIVFVPKGYGHYFHSLKNDFEVMILFEKKSMQAK
jgi:mannose-6-phosphate isomerase-like protein (cupin superfamily)